MSHRQLPHSRRMYLRFNLFWILLSLWIPPPRRLNGLKTTSPKTLNSQIEIPPQPPAVPPTPPPNTAARAPLTPKAVAPHSKSNFSLTSPNENSSMNWSLSTFPVQMSAARPFTRHSISHIRRCGIPPQINLSMSRFWECCLWPWRMRYIVILMRMGRIVRKRERRWIYISVYRLRLPRIRGIIIILRRWRRSFCKGCFSSMMSHYPRLKLMEGENE